MGRMPLALGLIAAIGCRMGFEHPASVDRPDMAPASVCSPAMFVADFRTIPSWAMTYTSGAATLNVLGGQLRVDLGTSAVNSAAGIYSSSFTLSEMRVSMHVDVALDGAPDARAYVCLSDCNAPLFDAVVVQNGMIRVEAYLSGSGVISSRIYDRSADTFWQVREHGGTTYVETSPDGSSWNRLVSYPTIHGIASQLWLGGWNNGDASGGIVSFAQFQSCLEP